jgi:hypothetical protein
VLYSSAVSRLRRPFLSDRFFFVTMRLLKRGKELREADFHFLRSKNPNLTAAAYWASSKGRAADLKGGGLRYPATGLATRGTACLA